MLLVVYILCSGKMRMDGWLKKGRAGYGIMPFHSFLSLIFIFPNKRREKIKGMGTGEYFGIPNIHFHPA